MSMLALAFMLGSWTLVLSLTGWCFYRVLRAGRQRDPAATETEPSR